MTFWFVSALMASALRIAVSPIHAPIDMGTILPYLLLVTAPLVSMGLALHWFRDGDQLPQPVTRLAVVGRCVGVAAVFRHIFRRPAEVLHPLGRHSDVRHHPHFCVFPR